MKNGDRVLIEFEVGVDPGSSFPFGLCLVLDDGSVSNDVAFYLTSDLKYFKSDPTPVKLTPIERGFKVGDRVYCPLFGEGVVKGIDDGDVFSIDVEFDSGATASYTSDGRYSVECNPTLTWS